MADSRDTKMIAVNSRAITDRPRLMDPSTGSLNPLTDDYEGWLITAPDDLKKQVISYTESTASGDLAAKKDRIGLAQEFTNSRTALLTRDKAYYDNLVSGQTTISAAISSHTVGGSTGTVPDEVQDLVNDVQSPGIEYAHKQTQLQFQLDLMAFNMTIDSAYQQNATRVQKVRGHATVMASYLNQKDPNAGT